MWHFILVQKQRGDWGQAGVPTKREKKEAAERNIGGTHTHQKTIKQTKNQTDMQFHQKKHWVRCNS